MEEESDTDCPNSSKCSAGSSTNQTETCGSSFGNEQGEGNDSFTQQLFLICDQDGDGFISSADLLKVLDDMGLEEAVDVDQILVEMGGSSDGRISYEQFVQCLISVRGDIEQVQVLAQESAADYDGVGTGHSLTVRQSSTPHCSDAESQGYSTFGTNSHSYCSGEIDSGARDCSPERYSRHVEQREHADCDVLLNFANKLHMAALVSLRNEVQYLQTKLRQSDSEIKRLSDIVAASESEKLKLVNQFEESLESQMAQYEERLTELHSILAEVQKKSTSLKDKDNVIIEEDEDEYLDTCSSVKTDYNKETVGSSLPPRPSTTVTGPVVESVCIKQAHVSKVLPQRKPLPPPRTDASKSGTKKSHELELERLKSSQNNVSALNDVLTQNLEESRSQAEKLFSLLLKYESIVGTQQLAIDASRKLCDAYEYLVKLLDMKHMVKSSTIFGANEFSPNRCQECRSRSLKSTSSDDSAEPDAEELFARLNGSADSRFLERKLRLLIQKLNEERKSYEELVDVPQIPVESLADETKFGTTAPTDVTKGDVEVAVLIQEIMSLKEERADLRSRLFQLERKDESRVVPKYFPGLASSLEALESAVKTNDITDLSIKVDHLLQSIKTSSLTYQNREDDLVRTISKMKHMLKFLVQLIGKQKRDSQVELHTLEELLQKF